MSKKHDQEARRRQGICCENQRMPYAGTVDQNVLLGMFLGGIDLSIVAIANLSSLVSAMILTGRFFDIEKVGQPVTILVAVVVAIVLSVLCSFINGVIISKFSVPPIVATLSTMTFYSGIAMALRAETVSAVIPVLL